FASRLAPSTCAVPSPDKAKVTTEVGVPGPLAPASTTLGIAGPTGWIPGLNCTGTSIGWVVDSGWFVGVVGGVDGVDVGNGSLMGNDPFTRLMNAEFELLLES